MKIYNGKLNSRKVTSEMERLILSLYCRPEKPYVATVHLDYLQFLAGNIEVVDFKTGEIFTPDDFINDDGTPITVSEGTIANIYDRRIDRFYRSLIANNHATD